MAGFFFPSAGKILDEIIGGLPADPTDRGGCIPSPGDLIRTRRKAEQRHRKREEAEERRREREEAAERRRKRAEAKERRRNRKAAEEMRRKRQEIEQMNRRLRRMERKIREDALKHEKRREKALARLARREQAIKMKGQNIGIFGLTSTGKSTMINSLLGNKLAETGAGETTKEMTPYRVKRYTLWDTPGRNDESTYTNPKYISFSKGLTRRLIVIQSTVKENLKLMRLLDSLGLGYDIVVNKFDDVDKDEQSKFQRQIEHEIRSLELKQKKNVFFLSAQYPKMFRDWLTMVNYLTKECLDYDQQSDTESDSSVISNSD